MINKIRHIFFIIVGVGSLFLTWPFAFAWVKNGGNIFDPLAFFTGVFRLGGAPAFLTIDIAVCWIVFMVWVVFDAKRIRLGMRWGWFFVALSYLGTCFAFPLYLVIRERHLDNTTIEERPLDRSTRRIA